MKSFKLSTQAKRELEQMGKLGLACEVGGFIGLIAASCFLLLLLSV